MNRCSAIAYARCPYHNVCGTRHEATFSDNSECAAFNKKVEGERIEYRRLDDAEEHSVFLPGRSETCKERENCELHYCDPEECPYFDPGPETNARRIRAMISTDEGLAKVLMELGDKGVYIPFCKGKSECLELLEIDAIPESKCMECLLDWLRHPVERED